MQYIDQLNRTITLDKPLKKIISLVPSQTELLFDLGLNDEVTGITKFCVHPTTWFQTKTKIGGTKQLKIDLIEKLNPDLIIGNKEENQKDQLEYLMQRWPVWVSDIKTLEDAISMIRSIGGITGKKSAAENIINNITTAFDKLVNATPVIKPGKAAYLIWNDPIMCAGTDTFISDMMMRCGFENVLHDARYPVVTIEQMKEINPAYILLSSEPFPFTITHSEYFQKLFSDAKIILVDGEYFSWYGSRLIKAPDYFSSLLKSVKSES